jgi:type II secretory pathway pseudopilin PulG
MLLKQNKKAGVTLIELLIVIAAAVALIAAGLVLFSDLQDSQRVKDESSNIANMYVGISNLFYEDSTTSFSTVEALQAGIIPDAMQVTGGVVYNAWGGTVTIDDNAAATANSFRITYTNIPGGDSCVDIIKSARKQGWDEVTVADSGGPNPMTGPAADTVFAGMTSLNIITLCAGGDGALSDISFEYEG